MTCPLTLRRWSGLRPVIFPTHHPTSCHLYIMGFPTRSSPASLILSTCRAPSSGASAATRKPGGSWNEASSVHSDTSSDSSCPAVSWRSAWLDACSQDLDLKHASPLLLNLRRRCLPNFESFVLSLTTGRCRGTMPNSCSRGGRMCNPLRLSSQVSKCHDWCTQVCMRSGRCWVTFSTRPKY